MTSRGKARSVLAPIKELIQSLELNKVEGACLTTLTADFLRKTKKLQANDIISLSDKALYKLARELLETETTPGEGPTGLQYWPSDDKFRRTLTYLANPSRIIKLVGYIMRNQRKNLADARRRQRRQAQVIVENPGPGFEPGPSSAPGVNLPTNLEPAMEGREASTEAAQESDDFPSFEEILGVPRKAPTPSNPSDSTDLRSHLATPPVTPQVSRGTPCRRTFEDNEPRRSLEVSPHPSIPAVQQFPAQEPFRPTIDFHSRRRARSPTAFADYNPRLPTHRDGTLDESTVKAWKDGVDFVKDRIGKFSRGLRKRHREHPQRTPAEQDAALQIYYRAVGLDEFLDFLESDLQMQEKRLNDFNASRAALGSSQERGLSSTLSP